MEPGTPLEVQRGYCLGETTFKQQGRVLARDSVMAHLERNSHSRPYLESGSAYAIGSIVATLIATPAIFVGAYAQQGKLEMSNGASTALLAGGIGVGVASWVLCITSDSKYVAGALAYNAQLNSRPAEDDGARVPEETRR